MWSNWYKTEDLVTSIEEIVNDKYLFFMQFPLLSPYFSLSS